MGAATETTPDPQQQYSLRWNDFHSSLARSLGHLRDKEEFVDVTLACEGYSFGVHKMVLSACSPYFRRLLKANPCNHPIIIMGDVNQKDMDNLLKFMYNGEVNIAQERLTDFLKIAQMLQVKGLSDMPGVAASIADHKLITNRTDDILNSKNVLQSSSSSPLPSSFTHSTEQHKRRHQSNRNTNNDSQDIDSTSNSNSSSPPPPKQPRLLSALEDGTAPAAAAASGERQNNNNISVSLLGQALEDGPNIIIKKEKFINHPQSESPSSNRQQSNCCDDSNSSDDGGGGIGHGGGADDGGIGRGGRGNDDDNDDDEGSDRHLRHNRHRRRYESDYNDRSDQTKTLKTDESIDFPNIFDDHLAPYPTNGGLMDRRKPPSFPTPPLLGLQGLSGLIGAAGPSGGLHGAGNANDFVAARRSLEMMKVRATDPRPCPQCGKIYRSAHTLRTHLEDKHTVCPGYRCVLCGTVAKSRNSLHSHMSRQHRGISTKDLPVTPMPAPFDPDLASRLLAKAGVKITPAELRARASPTGGGPRRSDVKLEAKSGYSGGAASEAGSSICGDNDPEDLTISHGRYNHTSSAQAAAVALAAKSFDSLHQQQQQQHLKESYAGHNMMGSALLDTYLQLISENGAGMMMGMMNPEQAAATAAAVQAAKFAQLNALGLSGPDKAVQQHYLHKISQQVQNNVTDDIMTAMMKKKGDEENSRRDNDDEALILNNRGTGGIGMELSDKKENEDLIASSVSEDDDFSDDDIDNDGTAKAVVEQI